MRAKLEKLNKWGTYVILATVLVGLVGLVYGYGLVMKGTSKTVTVVLKEEGYSPEEITIQKGDTVIFKTSLKEAFWPASNLHPLHEIYPEFDPQRPLDASESWSFRFNQKGTWQYHDHLSPYYTGIVHVK